MEKQIKKTMKIALIFLGIGVLLGSLIVFAATPSTTFYISGGNYSGAPAFTIWKEGSNYFAKNDKGLIAYSGTNISDITLDCINSVHADNGGEIFFTAGIYDFATSLTVIDKYYWIIAGVGRGGYQTSKLGQTVFRKGFNGDLINVSYTLSQTRNSFGIEGIVIHGVKGSYTGKGVIVKNARWFWISETRIFQTEDDGLYMTGCGVHRLNKIVIGECDGNGIYATSVGDAVWRDIEVNCLGQDANKASIAYSGGINLIGAHLEGWRNLYNFGSGISHITNAWCMFAVERTIYHNGGTMYLSNCRLQKANYGDTPYTNSSGAGIYHHGGSLYVVNCIIGLISADNTTYSIYQIRAASNAFVENTKFNLPVFMNGSRNHFTQNYFEDVATFEYETNFLINNDFTDTLDFGTGTNRIISNRIVGGVTGTLANNVFSDNSGFLTENSGLSAAISTGATVAHGLDVTPTVVTATAAESGPTDIYVTDIDATSFIINFGGGGAKTFYWDAEYRP